MRGLAWVNLMAMAVGLCGASPTHLRVQDSVKQAVLQSGSEVVIVGSWFKGGERYKDPLARVQGASDHDMRVRVPPGTPREEALEQWRRVRQEVERTVRSEFGKDADRILETINVYPPRELMAGVEDAADATRRYRSLGLVPGLGFKGDVRGSIDRKFVEGLYGQGSAAWTQSYENVSGRLIYPGKTADGKALGRAFTSTAESVNLLDAPQELLSAGGLGNTARQWGEHGLDALSEGDARLVAKYLERAERDLSKGARLAMVELPKDVLLEMQSLRQKLRTGENLASLRVRLTAAFDRARSMGQVMSRARTIPGPEQATLRVLLKSQEQGRLGDLVRSAAGKIPLDRVLDGIMLYMGACEISRAAADSDPGSALLAAADFLAPLGPVLAASLAREVLETSRQFGYDLMAASQDAFDLLEGIIAVGGRQTLLGNAYTIDQLVERYREGDEERLRAFIRARCAQATVGTGGQDVGVEESLYRRCMPVLMRAWLARRAQMGNEVIALRDAYLRMDLRLAQESLSPAQGTRPAQVSLRVQMPKSRALEAPPRMRELLRKLYGAGGYFVDIQDVWSPSPLRADERSLTATFALPKGSLSVGFTRTLKLGGPALPATSPLVSRRSLFAGLDVEPATDSTSPAPPQGGGGWVLEQKRQTLVPSTSFGGRCQVCDQVCKSFTEATTERKLTRTYTYKNEASFGRGSLPDTGTVATIQVEPLPERFAPGASVPLVGQFTVVQTGALRDEAQERRRLKPDQMEALLMRCKGIHGDLNRDHYNPEAFSMCILLLSDRALGAGGVKGKLMSRPEIQDAALLVDDPAKQPTLKDYADKTLKRSRKGSESMLAPEGRPGDRWRVVLALGFTDTDPNGKLNVEYTYVFR